MSDKQIPQKLYKYRAFDINSLKLLVHGQTYYSDPRNFNDPLDCNPTFKIDVNLSSLEKLFLKWQIESQTAAWEAGIAMAGVSGFNSESKERILERIQGFAQRTLSQLEYDSHRGDATYETDLVYEIEQLLRSNLGKHGVFSLSEIWNCPLMWSHYADEHRGICIEYDTTRVWEHERFSAVDYESPGIIKMSDVIAWKDNDLDASKRVYDAYFFTKAAPWRYEKEWRDIRSCAGADNRGFKVTAVYFGYSCDELIRNTIFKLFQEPSELQPNLYFIYRDGYDLKYNRYSPDPEFAACGVMEPRC